MGRFDTTKATINANIKKNGNQEITGNILNSVMTEIVDATDAQLTELSADLADGIKNALISQVYYLGVTLEDIYDAKVNNYNLRYDTHDIMIAVDEGKQFRLPVGEHGYIVCNAHTEGAYFFIRFIDNYNVVTIIGEANNGEILSENIDIIDVETIRDNLSGLTERIEENEVLIEDLQNTKIDKEADDYYPQLSVGTADNLSGVEVVSSEFTTRQSGGGAIADGVARVQSIKGNSVVWNQLARSPLFDDSEESWSYNKDFVSATLLDNGEIYAKGKGVHMLGNEYISPRLPLVSGHAYLYQFDIKKNISETIGVYLGDVWNNPTLGKPIDADIWYHVKNISVPTENLERGLWIYPWNNTTLTDCEAWIKNLVVYDLTKMFGEGNEPSTIEEFYQRIPMRVDLYAYNEGEVISMNINGIKSVGVKEGEESTEDLSIVGKYFPNGMNGVGSAYDDIRYNKSTNKWEKVVRFGEVELGTLSYSKSGIGTHAFYTLSLQGKVKNAGKLLTSQFCQVGGITSSRDAEMSVDSVGTIYFSLFAHTDAASFKAAMQGVVLYYELAEPIVTEIEEQDFNTDYLVWNGGSEEALASKPSSPLKADITYGFNAVGKIKELEEKINSGGGGVSKDYVDGKLTELSAEVSGLSERIENLPTAESSVFEAVFGVTTYDEIVEAVKAKKHIICFHKNRVYNLCNFQQGMDLLFTCAAAAIYTITLKISNSNWVESQYDYEIAINKVTTINESSTNTKYPSAKAVYDFVNNTLGTIINGDY